MICIGGVQLWNVSGCIVVVFIRGVQLWYVSGVYSCGTYRGCTVVIRIGSTEH